jgi:asparagine synthase (glutamine-hydrolysing)
MCGIAGIVRWDGRAPALDDVQAMCDVLFHRGPDDQGFYVDNAAALGMRRLSIIDLETGRQPMANEDGTVWVVFNGEIYNFKELRRYLQNRGHRFSTTSDTETIVHLYEEFGADLVDHLRGMFAIAVWDAARRQLLLVRDRLGIKPLFYASFVGGFAFASELKSILQVPEIGRRLNWQALGHLCTFLATPAAESIIDGVCKLEPGHRATLSSAGALTVERYWEVRFEPDNRTGEDELVERLNSLLVESVNLHMRSDVPLGVFLSGGLDSAAVLATMARLTNTPVKTFSIGFTEGGFDELPHARLVAAAFGTEHHELVLEPTGLDLLEDLVWHLDEPFGDPSAIPTYMVSKLAAEHVKVVLTGDGGDEIFGGYDKYLVEQRERAYDYIPAPLRQMLGAIGRAMPEGATGRNFLRHLAFDSGRRYLNASTLFGRAEQAKLFRPDVFERVSGTNPWDPALSRLAEGGGSWLSALQYWDLHCYLPLDILAKVDRMTMAHSIEARPALLDHQLVEFAATVPSRFVLKGRTTKYLLKRAMRGVLPEEIIHRRKHGFSVPLSSWFRHSWRDFVRDLLLSDTCGRRGIFDSAYIEHLLRLHDRGRDLEWQLWTLMSFELWCRTFLDRRRTRTRHLHTPDREFVVRGAAQTAAAGRAS